MRIEFSSITLLIFKSVIVKLPKNIFFNPEDVDDDKRVELLNYVSIMYILLN